MKTIKHEVHRITESGSSSCPLRIDAKTIMPATSEWIGLKQDEE